MYCVYSGVLRDDEELNCVYKHYNTQIWTEELKFNIRQYIAKTQRIISIYYIKINDN